MTERKNDNELLDFAEVSATAGGRVIIPDSGRSHADVEMTDPELEAAFDREDDGLLDTDSPEFDHSLRKRKV